MTKKKLRLICLSITLILAVCLLAGCNNADNDNLPGFVYLPEYISLPAEIDSVDQACYADGQLYFSSYSKTGERQPEPGEPAPGTEYYYEGMYDVYSTVLYKINIDGTGLEQLPNYVIPAIPEGLQGNSYIQRINLDGQGNIWVIESSYFYHYEGDGQDQLYVDDGSTFALRKLDKNGAELANIDLTALGENKEYFYIQDFLIGPDGHIYISDGENAVYAFTADGQPAFEVQLTNYSYNMVLLADGRVANLTYGQNGMEMHIIDAATKNWGQTIDLPRSINTAYSGHGSYDLYYTSGSSFYGYSVQSKTAEKLVNWIDVDMDGDPYFVVPLDDQQILCLSYNYDDSGENNQELILLTKTDRSAVPERKIITMASMYTDYNLRGQVVKFNKANSEYRIQINDYSEYATDDDWNAGLTKLNTEIISGTVPDIIIIDNLPIKQYAAKGLIEDLIPYIENDKELGGMKAFLTNVFEACKVGDILPYIASSFGMQTVVGASRVVGSQPGWTMDELNAALATMPEGATAFNSYMTKSTLLQYICMVNIDDYVDWSEGKSNFDSEEFIKLLEFCKTAPDDIDYENIDWETYEDDWQDDATLIKEGKMMLTMGSIYDLSDFPYLKGNFQEPITFIGFPSANSIGSVFSMNNGLAMSSTCKHKDAAWKFMRTILTEEYQKENMWWGLPTNKAVFDYKIEQALNPDSASAGSISVRADYAYEEEIDRKLTPADIEQITSLIDQITTTATYDQFIMDIISEEAAAFFAGQKSAAETAKVIQSRVGIYVSEQS